MLDTLLCLLGIHKPRPFKADGKLYLACKRCGYYYGTYEELQEEEGSDNAGADE